MRIWGFRPIEHAGRWLGLGIAVAIALCAAPERAARAMFWTSALPSPLPAALETRAAIAPGTAIEATTTAALETEFAPLGYTLESVRRGQAVPRALARAMPGDLTALGNPDRRKAAFIRIALPLILAVNEAIRADRARLKALRERLIAPGRLSLEDSGWLRGLFAAYRVEPFDFDALLRRVDVIPPSLALAQSAEESGWGTSRFAQVGNALFGQRIFKGRKGLIPHDRAPGERFRVRRFAHLLAGVDAYALNLNTHPAYGGFRAERAAMRARGAGIDAAKLATRLESYSERGGDYIATIGSIMRRNRLSDFDRAALETTDTDAAAITVESTHR